LFKEANQIDAETLGDSHHFYAESITSLAFLYQSMDDLKKAKRLLTKANSILAKSYSTYRCFRNKNKKTANEYAVIHLAKF